RLVREHRITQVVDVSSIDTLDCARVCDELGAHLLCTSVEEWPGKGTMPTDDAIAPFLPDARPRLERASCLVGSGANPGIVHALVFAGLREFSRRTAVAASVAALEIHAILITEEDTTRETSVRKSDDSFPLTWSPHHCLEEIFERRAFVC